jgi:fucose permease
MVVSISAFLFTYVGIEVGYGGWISTYSINKNIMESSDAAISAGIFWSFITLGRLISIYLVLKFDSKFLLKINIYGCIFSSAFLVLIAKNS